MSFVNKYLRNFKPYEVASHKIWQVPIEQREQIIKLDWNESTIQPSPKVKQRLQQLLETDFLNLYPKTYNEELYYLLSSYSGIPVKNIQYFASSDSLHEYISHMFISVGDPVLLVWPSYDNFRLTAEVAGANIIYFEFNDDFSFDALQFEVVLKEKNPSLVYICNPNNPIGYLMKKEYLEKLVNQFPETMFLIDEAYIEFAEQETCKDLVINNDNILISRTLSKAFGLANIRFGYLLASEKNITYISSIRNPKNITTLAQEAVIGALSDIEYMKNNVDEIKKTRKKFVFEINQKCAGKLYAKDGYGNFVIIRCKDFQFKAYALELLEKNNIFVRNLMYSKKIENCIRVTIGTEVQMERVINVLQIACQGETK